MTCQETVQGLLCLQTNESKQKWMSWFDPGLLLLYSGSRSSFRRYGLLWGVWTTWRLPVQHRGKHWGSLCSTCFPSPHFIPCPASFVFLCQVSLTYDALALADNILFKQICRWKPRWARTTIKLAPGWIICQWQNACSSCAVLALALFSFFLRDFFIYLSHKHKKSLTKGVLLLK